MYFDIHTHILPGIDDGARDMEQAKKMLQTAYENHITTMIVTPHNKADRHNAEKHTIEEKTAELQQYADEKKYGIQIYTGTEFFYRSDLTVLLNQKQACTMAGSSYVLVEFSPMEGYAYIRDGLYHILSAGYWPILAHVERYQSVMKAYTRVKELIDMGCYIQVNAGSILGKYGFKTRKDVKKLLQNGWVHFVATDAHNDEERAPDLAACANRLYRKYDEAYVDELLKRNPEKVIQNKYL